MMSEASVYISPIVAAVAEMRRDLPVGDGETSIETLLSATAERLSESWRQREFAARIANNWHPRLIGIYPPELFDEPFTPDDARLSIAREHGFADWADVQSRGQVIPDPTFERAVDLVVGGGFAELRKLISADSTLVQQRSAFGHRATLLVYLTANGVETERQTVASNAVEIADLLFAAGADPNATTNMYGGSTPLGLLISSDHPHKAGLTGKLAAVFRAAGAE